jgi:hypothetical protein
MQEAEATSHVLALPLPMFPAGLEHAVGNHKFAGTTELIYDVAWIPELGIWRRFLQSRRKLPN